jgi:soluble lytic murein transglycosylase-like protein
MYYHGRGVPRDHGVALLWFQAAAQKGDPYAQRMLTHIDSQAKPRKKVCQQPPWQPTNCRGQCLQIVNMVKKLAPRYGLEPTLALAVIKVESSFQVRAKSRKNAQGLMQLLPTTAKRFGVKNTWDPEENIKGGMAYLQWLLDYFGGDVRLALAAYNAGEGAVERHGGIPPYEETRAYVAKVLQIYGKAQRQ